MVGPKSGLLGPSEYVPRDSCGSGFFGRKTLIPSENRPFDLTAPPAASRLCDVGTRPVACGLSVPYSKIRAAIHNVEFLSAETLQWH